MTKKILFVFVFLFALTVFVGSSRRASAMDAHSCGETAEVWWKPQPGAAKYHIYFTEEASWMKWAGHYNHAVRNVPVADMGMRELEVHCLQHGVKYVARVSAVGRNGKEYWWSDMIHLKPM